MRHRQPHPAHGAASLALQTALKECTAAGLNHELLARELTDLVCAEARKALSEMAEHYATGGPSAILMLAQPIYQNIYFADAGRRAAETLIKNNAKNPRRHSSLLGT